MAAKSSDSGGDPSSSQTSLDTFLIEVCTCSHGACAAAQEHDERERS